MNIGEFGRYREENFEASQWEGKILDKRKRPEIPTAQVFTSLSEMPVFGQKSLSGVDAFLKTPQARKWHGSDRLMVASDTTIERVAEGMERLSVETVGYEVIDKGDQEALWDLKLPSGRKLRLGIVDGHWAGGIWASVLAVGGKCDGVVDLECYPGRGHELDASRKLLKRAFDNLGKGFFTVVAGDGLYASREDFQLCLDEGSHLLVKTDEEGLSVIQDAQYLFTPRNTKDFQGVGRKAGDDVKRKIDYEVWWVEEFDWQGLKMTVAWVKEHHRQAPKGQPEDTAFWVLTTITGLTGEDLRELAHRRWEIENNIFKRLNHLVGSKRRWSQKPKVMEMFLRIWMIGLTILGAYLFQEGWKTIKNSWGAVKKTWQAVTDLMKVSVVRDYG
jgi:hypothetical protein